MITLTHVLRAAVLLGGVLFAIAVAGVFLNRKNVIVLLMCIELMLLAVNFNFVAFSRYLGDISGQIFVFFILSRGGGRSRHRPRNFGRGVPRTPQHRCRRSRLAPGLRTEAHFMQGIYCSRSRLAPLLAAIIAGLFGKAIGRSGAHGVTIAGVGVSCALSFYVLYRMLWDGLAPFNGTVYTWLVSDGLTMNVGFLIDRLSAMMMVVVTFVSLMVHIYTIGYMHDDDGYQRFFSYISLFTFSMLMLVMSEQFHAAVLRLGKPWAWCRIS